MCLFKSKARKELELIKFVVSQYRSLKNKKRSAKGYTVWNIKGEYKLTKPNEVYNFIIPIGDLNELYNKI